MSDEHEHAVDVTPEAAELREVVDGVFAWVQPDGTWWINNAGAVTGGDGTLVVDTCATARRTGLLLDTLVLATDGAPITRAVNTHHHGDHTYGNSLLPASAVLFGHEAMRDELLVDPIIDECPPAWEPVPVWGDVTRRVPNVVTRSGLTIYTGARRVDLLHPGHTAHTVGDLVAWLPDERVLFAGDLVFHGLTPLAFAGSVDGARRTLDWLAGFEPDHLVPGHGPLVSAAELADVLGAHERYYRLVLDTAEAGRRDGLTPLAAAEACDLGEFADWADAERLVLNVHRAYADAEDRDLDLAVAMIDAMTWNGGPLTTHVCCGG